MVNPLIAVPYRPDHGWRDQLWSHCLNDWYALGWPAAIHPGPAGPFNRSAAVNRCAHLGEPWDVMLIVDADILTPPRPQLDRAVELADRTGQLVVAYERRLNLDATITRRILEGRPVTIDGHFNPLEGSLSSVVAVPRRLWDTVGGMDERFEGWGCDDTAFHHACNVIGGGWHRIAGDVAHLWHDRAPERQRSGQPMHPLLTANKALVARYRDRTTPADVVDILTEPGGPLHGRYTAAQVSTYQNPTSAPQTGTERP